MANFCTNCGNKLQKGDNFCTNCGAKIDKSDINQNSQMLKSVKDRVEKEKAEETKKVEKIEIPKEKEMIPEEINQNEIINGGYCSLNCIHCYEEYLDSYGSIEGDFDSGGSFEYYCNLGYYVSFGRFCEDYE